MKKFIKILSSLMVVATLGTTFFITPIGSDALDMNKDNPYYSDSYYKENSIKNAIFMVKDGEFSSTYYLVNGYIYTDGNCKGTVQYPVIDENIDISAFETIIIDAEESDEVEVKFLVDRITSYSVTSYIFSEHTWESILISMPKQEDKEPTIGTSENEKNKDGLYSVPTGIRGDVNYDGLVNNIDVMVLRKYILHLIEW